MMNKLRELKAGAVVKINNLVFTKLENGDWRSVWGVMYASTFYKHASQAEKVEIMPKTKKSSKNMKEELHVRDEEEAK